MANYVKAKRKIKVMRVVSRMNIGGPSVHVALLSKKLNSNRFCSILITGTISSLEGDMSYLLQKDDIVVKHINELQREINPARDLVTLFKIFKMLIKEKPDIVHSHMAKAGAAARLAVGLYNLLHREHKIRMVHTFHGHVLEGYFSKTKSLIFQLIERLIAKFTDAIIAISQTQKWELTHKYRIAEPEKVYTINLGLNLSPFLSSIRFNQRFRKRIGVDENTILIGIVGRLVPIKNHFMFLNAAKLFIVNNAHLPVKFIIVGDGELREALKEHTKKLQIQDRVIFHGWEKNISEVYSDLNILVLTSMNEGTPVSIIEAMASSVPVITTGVGGVRDLLGRFEEKVQDKSFIICERGILLKKGDHLGLANGLQKFLENDDTKRILKARQFVKQYYSDNRLVNSMERLYESII